MRAVFFSFLLFTLLLPRGAGGEPLSAPQTGMAPEADAFAALLEDNADGGSSSGGRGNGWIRLEEGSRPAYVGIHGGTAPISLLRSPGGVLFALTGTTGNDFSRILRRDATRNGTEFTADVAAATFSPLPDEDFQPFGLSNPEGVSAVMGGRLEVEAYSEEAVPAPVPPLRLRSYLRLLKSTDAR
ncbi:MAG: hypothetical protein LBB52_02195 [Desulfovibrio sp.]|nr:hypothetical protein [Desulfovibrio sp.]